MPHPSFDSAARRHRWEAWQALFDETARRRLCGARRAAAALAMVEEMLADDTRSVHELVSAALPVDH